MKQRLLLVVLLLNSIPVFAEINPKDLVKVDKNIQQQCVEYYSYHGEMYCSTKALQATQPSAEILKNETQVITFDDRPWQAAWTKKTDKEVVVEYVPQGDDINNWHELITSQYFAGIQDAVTPKQFADRIANSVKEVAIDPTITFHKETPNQVIFEFRFAHPIDEAQDELQIITKGKNGIYVLHYTAKVSDMGEAKRKLWLSNLEKVKIK